MLTLQSLLNSPETLPTEDRDFESVAINGMASELKKLRAENAILKSEVSKNTDEIREKELCLSELSTALVHDEKLRKSLEVELARKQDEIDDLTDKVRWLDIELDQALAASNAQFKEAYCWLTREISRLTASGLLAIEQSLPTLQMPETYSRAERRVAIRTISKALDSFSDSINRALETAEKKACGLED